jgi:hypothetical protein
MQRDYLFVKRTSLKPIAARDKLIDVRRDLKINNYAHIENLICS